MPTLIIMLSLIVSASAQDTVFCDANTMPIKSKSSAVFYKVIDRDKSDTDKVTVRKFSMNGQILFEENFSPYSKGVYNGEYKSWFVNGQLRTQLTYLNSNFDKDLITFWNNGKLKRKDKYDNGKFISGECYDSTGAKVPHYEYAVMPKFPEANLYAYLAKHIKYPEKERSKGISGTAYMTFVVDRDGSVTDVKVLKGTNNEDLDNEAIRVISSMPKWSPGILDGQPVRKAFYIPIKFD
jgi:protein TonB